MNDDTHKRGRGRPAEFPDRLSVPRLPKGGKDRLEAVLRPGEGPGEFMRNAIMAEIERREDDKVTG